MRSNSVKEPINNHPTKGKKVMQFANLISTYHNEKNKLNAEKKTIQTNKSCNHYKPHLNNDLAFDMKKNIHDKFKPNLKSQHQVKRHNRSKTQNFDPNLYESSTLNLFKDIHLPSKLNSKKGELKKEDSKKRLKTESLKRLNPAASSKTSSKQFKKYFNPIAQKPCDIFSKQKKQKATKKQNMKANQQRQKLYQIGNDLQALKGKFKKQKSDYQNASRTKIFSMKDQRKDKSKTDNKNFSLLNLSQILHKSQYEDFLYPQQKQVRNKQAKSDRSSNSKKMPIKKNKVQVLKNLSRLVDHYTSSIAEQIEQNHQNKLKHKNNENDRNNYDIGGRSFSFTNQMINQEMKHGKSNFSTGVDSIALDEEIQQLIKLKLKTQKQINKKISKEIKQIALSYQVDEKNPIDESKIKINEKLQIGEKSARTFRQNNQQQRKNQNEEKLMLLDLLQKYNQMTQKMVPFIYQHQLKNPEQYILQDVAQKSHLQQIEFLQKHNRKNLSKFNQITVKNKQYQEIINALIQDGVNVEKYMISYFKSK